jgi:polar amino acid transport system substrate-binding protein
MGASYAFLVAGLLAAGAGAQPPVTQVTHLTILTEHSPPTSMLENGAAGGEGMVIGAGTDKVREVMTRTGIGYTMELQPWKRAYTAALERPDTCVFSTTRLPEREALFKWVGPTDSADWVLLGRSDHRYVLHTLDDARRLRIGTYIGDARDAYLRERGFKVDPAQNDLINPEKLLIGRIDLWAASLRRGSAILQQNGWTDKIVPVLVFRRVDLYLACHPNVPDALVARMNAAIVAMGKDGTMKRIEKKYEGWKVLR